MRVAVVGGGVSGLAAAHELLSANGGVRVTLYEQEESLGGQARTVAVDDGAGGCAKLDLGFMSFNQVTYPHMMEWLEGLGVEMERSDMSFSVSTQSKGGGGGCEWGNGNGISGLLAQKTNILKPSFWRMVSEIIKFKNDALTYLEDHEHNPDLDHNETLGQFIQSHGYSLSFQEAYLMEQACGHVHHKMFSACLLSSCCHFAVIMTFFSCFVTPSFPLSSLVRSPMQTRQMQGLNNATIAVGGFRVLENDGSEETYDSKIESARPFLVTLNPPCVPDHVLLKWNTRLPVPSVAVAKAYLQLDQIQGKRGIWFCGTYQGHGFYEDGLKSGKAAAQDFLGKKCELLLNPKKMIPSWTEAVARFLVARVFNQYISIGNLILVEERGSVFTFGKACDKCRVKSVIQVHDPLFYWKVAIEGGMGLAEAYIDGCFSVLDKTEGLLNLILILIANRDERRNRRIARKGFWLSPVYVLAQLAYAKHFLHHTSMKNTATQTRRNISQHYDLSNDFFSLFLDKSMTYSCAVFKDNESLEAAQQHKLSLLINKAKVKRGHHVLDIGSGWGSLAMEAVKQTGCKYTGVTLSAEQHKYAERKVREAGLEDRINFLLCDYRKIPPFKYDAIISCGMIEHVGHEYMDEFFACCESYLAEDGILVLQFISVPEERYEQYRKRPDFIKEYIFPGGCIPSLARIMSAMTTSSRFCIEHVENIGPNYYTTLMHWRDNFMANKDEVLALGFDERFLRIWEYYLIFSAAGFKSRALGDYQVVFSRPGNRRLGQP
ncbi:uncharacterized protein LOC119358352 [Triticum dicoccoides]|uniref:uncharacterized protein LOC119358352 n=1 Tax=Triticum dicoccoides TaxID=85692 RepID=UPI00189075E1|nr:uncharacterized protein LOC119358352 [Triticum dicoccoides]